MRMSGNTPRLQFDKESLEKTFKNAIKRTVANAVEEAKVQFTKTHASGIEVVLRNVHISSAFEDVMQSLGYRTKPEVIKGGEIRVLVWNDSFFDQDARFNYLLRQVEKAIESAVLKSETRALTLFDPCNYNEIMFDRLVEHFSKEGLTCVEPMYHDPFAIDPQAGDGISVRGWYEHDR